MDGKDQRCPGLCRRSSPTSTAAPHFLSCASPLLASLPNPGGQQPSQARLSPDVPTGPGLAQLLHQGPAAQPGEQSAQPPAASSLRVSSSCTPTLRVCKRAPEVQPLRLMLGTLSGQLLGAPPGLNALSGQVLGVLLGLNAVGAGTRAPPGLGALLEQLQVLGLPRGWALCWGSYRYSGSPTAG